MFSRPTIMVVLLGAMFGLPYVLSHMKSGTDAGVEPSVSETATAGTVGRRRRTDAIKLPQATNSRFGQPDPANITPVHSLAEVLRMDVSNEWVYSRWPRKSTGLSDPERFGVRVPLLTGTRPSDLAGSLTYYFGAEGRVEHLSLRGHTGDTTQVVALAVRRFGLRPQPSSVPGEQLFQIKQDGRVKSELRTRPAPVLRSSSPHSSFLVELELERGDSGRYLDERSQRLPSTIAGIPVAPQQIEHPQPVPVGPLAIIERASSRFSKSADSSEPTAEQAAAAGKAATREQPAEEPAAEKKVEYDLGVRRRWRWGN